MGSLNWLIQTLKKYLWLIARLKYIGLRVISKIEQINNL